MEHSPGYLDFPQVEMILRCFEHPQVEHFPGYLDFPQVEMIPPVDGFLSYGMESSDGE